MTFLARSADGWRDPTTQKCSMARRPAAAIFRCCSAVATGGSPSPMARSPSRIASAASAWILTLIRRESPQTTTEPSGPVVTSVTAPRLIEAQWWYGRALCHTGSTATGLALVASAEQRARQHHGADAHITGVVLMNLAFARHFAGDLKHAPGPIAEAHGIAARREPIDSQLRAQRRTYAVELSLLAGNTRLAEQAIAMTPYGPLPGPERFRERLPWINRAQAAWLELERGLPDRAAPELAEAVAKLAGWQMASLAARYRLHLASALMHNGKLQEAEDAAGKVLQHFQAREPRGLRIAQAWGVLGEIHLAAGRNEQALETADQVLSIVPASTSINSPNAAASFLRGKALLRLGRADDALPLLAAVAAYWHDFDVELSIAAETMHWHLLALTASGVAGAGHPTVAAAPPRTFSVAAGGGRPPTAVP